MVGDCLGCKHDATVGSLVESINNLKRWQEVQNGSIMRVEGWIHSMIMWVMGTAVVFGSGLVANLLLLLLRGKGG